MARPADWTPLGLSADPVPGDPEQVSQEAAHLRRMATTLTDQIAALRKIADGGADAVLVGQYAEKIRLSASDLAGQLGKVVGRYQKVSSALSQWGPDLEQAQAQSAAALNEAEGPYRTLQIKPDFPASCKLSHAQQQDKQYYDRSMQRAQAGLDAAKAKLARAVRIRDERASHWAGVINSAIDDGVKDSFWDGVVGAWIVDVIKDLCTILEIAATVLAIMALFATGVGEVLLLAFAATAVALVLRTLLAATGQGSWLDVAWDAFALLTLDIAGGVKGAAGLVGRATATVDEAIAVGDRLTAAQRDASLLGKIVRAVGKYIETIHSHWFVPNFLAKPLMGVVRLAQEINEAAHPLPSTMPKALLRTTAWRRMFHTGEIPATLARRMETLVKQFPDSPEIKQLAGTFRGQLWQLRGVVGSGAIGCWLGGKYADRWGRTYVTSGAMVISGSCAVAVGLLFGMPLTALLPVLVIWGISVVADSAQFSTMVTELADPAYVGTALTLQLALGFTLTVAARCRRNLPLSKTLVMAVTTTGSNLVEARELMMRITYSGSMAAW